MQRRCTFRGSSQRSSVPVSPEHVEGFATDYAETRVLDVVPSRSKDDRGIVTVESKGFNQRGEEVCNFRRKVMVWKRDHAPARRRPYGEAVWD